MSNPSPTCKRDLCPLGGELLDSELVYIRRTLFHRKTSTGWPKQVGERVDQ
jgi:hypothetical protein